jgi:hypothetical protein
MARTAAKPIVNMPKKIEFNTGMFDVFLLGKPLWLNCIDLRQPNIVARLLMSLVKLKLNKKQLGSS